MTEPANNKPTQNESSSKEANSKEPSSTASAPAKTPSKLGAYKWLFWIAVFLGLTWFLQQQGPITVNGISLTVPVSEAPPEEPKE